MNGYQDKDGNQEETIYIQIHYQDMNGGNQMMQMKDLKEQDHPITIISMMPLLGMPLKISEELVMIILLFTTQNSLQQDITLAFLLKITKEIICNTKMKMRTLIKLKNKMNLLTQIANKRRVRRLIGTIISKVNHQKLLKKS